MTAVWFTLSARFGNALSWFALIAAVDIALLERWTGRAERLSAAWIVPTVTLLCCLGSLWLITALSISQASGFALKDSTAMMGTGLFENLLQLRFESRDWLFFGLAPVLAYVLANAGRVNGRRQSP
jgi:hypothetical protein